MSFNRCDAPRRASRVLHDGLQLAHEGGKNFVLSVFIAFVSCALPSLRILIGRCFQLVRTRPELRGARRTSIHPKTAQRNILPRPPTARKTRLYPTVARHLGAFGFNLSIAIVGTIGVKCFVWQTQSWKRTPDAQTRRARRLRPLRGCHFRTPFAIRIAVVVRIDRSRA